MKKFLFCLLCFWGMNVFATTPQFYSNNLNSCKITKNILNDYEPKVFESTNNLLRKTGQLSKYSGEKILIKGRVLDQNCVPVSDAKIYLWQVGQDGRYPYEPLRVRVDKKRFYVNKDSSFTGSGIATSNNKGEYHFITMRSSRFKNANIRVEHPSLKTLQTRLELVDKNICTDECGEISQDLFTIEQEIKAYCFDLVLSGTTLKRY
ncbi:dioxygenase [Rickettsia endosymbiont of Halotydeus destructor]|uniref:dioxygenase family protein n=1 Tax=Rickettsia endosymbiont of Halotydeus destructor TaxID=2996754 RepID=UPI003BAF58C4